jgi:hypothetical protein
MTDRRLGIGIGLVLGVAAVILFVFVFSDDTVDAPAVDESKTAQTTTAPADDEGDRPDKQATRPEKPEEPDEPEEPPLATIEVAGGAPVGGVQTLETGKGEQIAFEVVSDVADEVHVHGYDISKDVEAGGKVRFSFVAEIDGIFEVEMENAGVQIAELRVNP